MPQFRIGFTLSTRLLSPLSLSPGTPGTHTTRRQNLSPAATYQTCICSEEKQRNIIYRGPCCFLKHFIKKKIFFVLSECFYVPITELVPAEPQPNGHHPFPQGIHCLVGKRNTETTTSNPWMFQK